MKYIVLFLGLILATSANAQTPISKQQADTYFASCVQNSAATEKRFSKGAQEKFCACTASRLTQFFSVEDMQVMTSQTDPNARLAMNKMIVNVYAPCMETPTRDLYNGLCDANPQVNQQVCRCTADAIANHMKANGAQIFSDILTRNPNIVDPMAALEDDPTFQQFKESAAKNCIR